MGELTKKAELLSQNPTIGSILGVINEIARAVDKLSEKEIISNVLPVEVKPEKPIKLSKKK